MVKQVSFNTSGNEKILVHITQFSLSKLDVSRMDVRQFVCRSQNRRLFREINNWNSFHKWIGFVYSS